MKDVINILGQEYKLIFDSPKLNPKLTDSYGYCEPYSHKIVIANDILSTNEVDSVENIGIFLNKVIRHEIIHAFFGESGLKSNSDYAENEELVDWIAIQFPKMMRVFEELGITA